YTYNPVTDRLTDIVHKDAAGAVLASYAYTNNALGQKMAVLETTREADNTLSTEAITWIYDELGRLIREQHDSSVVGRDFTTDYDYDRVGTRLDRTTTRETGPVEHTHYTYNARDELLTEVLELGGVQSQTTNYTYDANGSLTGKTVSGGETATYGW